MNALMIKRFIQMRLKVSKIDKANAAMIMQRERRQNYVNHLLNASLHARICVDW